MLLFRDHNAVPDKDADDLVTRSFFYVLTKFKKMFFLPLHLLVLFLRVHELKTISLLKNTAFGGFVLLL